MQSQVAPPDRAELDLLLHRDTHDDWRRWRLAAAGSAVFHLIAVAGLLSYQGTAYVPRPPERMFTRHVTPLVTPPELTQKAPNKTPVRKEMVLETIAPRPAVKAPAPAPAARAAVPPPPPPLVARVEPKPVFIEPPAMQPPVQTTPELPRQAEVPRLALQDVPPRDRGTGTGKLPGAIAIPNNSVQEAVRS